MVNERPGFAVLGREDVARTSTLSVFRMRIGPGQSVPTHYHTWVADHFFCLKGQMVLRVHDPEERFELLAGDSATVEPGRAHALRNESGKECVFLLVQGVGEYDFNHVEM